MARYQLTIPPGTGATHTPFICFNNGQTGHDRFVVVATQNRLTQQQSQIWGDRIFQFHNSDIPMGRRSTNIIDSGGFNGDYTGVAFEYLRYCMVWHGDNPPYVACMDTLCDVEMQGVSERAFRADQSLARTAAETTIPPDCHTGARVTRYRKMHYNTSTHGGIILKLSIYNDPDIRNGMEIITQIPVTRENAWGTFVRPINPKRTMMRRMLRTPNPFPKNCTSCASANASNFYEPSDGYVAGETTLSTLHIPRGGAGSAYHVDVSS
jgi:hypothetical protein